MAISNNYLGGGGASGIEMQKEYFQKIDEIRKQKIENQTSEISAPNFAKLLKQSPITPNSSIIPQNIPLKNPLPLEDGTDLALQKIAKEYKSQAMGVLWNIISSSARQNYEGGLAEEMFAPDLLNELVKNAESDGKMDDLTRSIYNELKRNQPNPKKTDKLT
jgi:hypothetical protein